MASTSKKTKDDAAYDPREAAVPLLSSFRQGRAGSPSGSSVTTLDADPQESDTDVEPVPETPAVGEATHKLRMLGKPEVCTDLETETIRFLCPPLLSKLKLLCRTLFTPNYTL